MYEDTHFNTLQQKQNGKPLSEAMFLHHGVCPQKYICKDTMILVINSSY